jgi:hypothetical protein
MFIPVVDKNQKPLMPTIPSRARKWIKFGKATPFWKGGVFCVRLNVEPSDTVLQEVVVGIDPGSKREGYSVISASHTYLNIQAEARDGVKESEAQSTMMRRTRRNRKTPCRKPKHNKKHAKIKLPPSTKSRWQWKLNICRWLGKIFPISSFVVEDIAAMTKKKAKKWNRNFSPLEVGKRWFYEELRKLCPVTILRGYETKAIRDQLGFKKSKKKLDEHWNVHCVDSWCLAYSVIGGRMQPDNKELMCIAPLIWHRRQLHRLKFEKGGIRKVYGGTLSLGIKRGTLIQHKKWGKVYIGGTMDGRVSVHDSQTGKRLAQNVKVSDCTIIKLLRWKTRVV